MSQAEKAIVVQFLEGSAIVFGATRGPEQEYVTLDMVKSRLEDLMKDYRKKEKDVQ